MAVGIIVIKSLWAELPFCSPANTTYSVSLYYQATLCCLSGLTQACDHSKRCLGVSQGRSLEERTGAGSSRKSFDHCLSFLVDSFQHKK